MWCANTIYTARSQSCGKENVIMWACRVEGHNRKSCPINSQFPFDEENPFRSNIVEDDYDDDSQQHGNVGNIDIVSFKLPCLVINLICFLMCI